MGAAEVEIFWEVAETGLGAIETDITARQAARILNNMDCLVMGRSILHCLFAKDNDGGP